MRSAAYIVVLWVVTVATPASAQTSDVALARQLFAEGIELVDQQAWAEAADRFRRSLELRPSPIVAFNLGSTLVELGRLVDASEAFRRAIRAAGAPAELRAAAEESLRALEPRIGFLTLTVTGPAEGVELFIGERRLPPQAIGVAAPIDPGTQHIRAVRAGQEIASVDLEIEEGARDDVVLDIPLPVEDDSGEEVVPDPIFTTTSTQSDGGISPFVWVGVGAGVLVVAAVVVVVILLTSQGDGGEPVPGNLTPAIVEF